MTTTENAKKDAQHKVAEHLLCIKN